MINLSPLLKLIGDESRLMLLSVLKADSYCVSDLVSLTGLSQSLISHHLHDLKAGELVSHQKNGKWVNYSLTKKGQKVMVSLEEITK